MNVLTKLHEDLQLMRLSPKTIDMYCSACRRFLIFMEYDPDTFSEDQKDCFNVADIRKYLFSLLDSGYAARTVNYHRCAIVLCSDLTLGCTFDKRLIPHAKVPLSLPATVTPEDFIILMSSTQDLKTQVYLSLGFGSGLRVSEIASLKVTDILSASMQLHVAHSKGGKERYTVLGKETLQLLRHYWVTYRPENDAEWLFPSSKNTSEHVSSAVISKAFKTCVVGSKIKNHYTMHSLRHGFACALSNAGTPLNSLRILLGHASLSTTVRYLQYSGEVQQTVSPVDLIKNKLITNAKEIGNDQKSHP
jgi:site-specific recombinase XerD